MKYTLFISDYRRIILSFLRLFSFDLSSCGLWEEEVKTTAGGESFVRHWIIKVNAQEFWLISSAQSRQLKIWLISSAQSPQFKSNGWLRIWLISSDQESSLFRRSTLSARRDRVTANEFKCKYISSSTPVPLFLFSYPWATMGKRYRISFSGVTRLPRYLLKSNIGFHLKHNSP